jgi:hypothetical protein
MTRCSFDGSPAAPPIPPLKGEGGSERAQRSEEPGGVNHALAPTRPSFGRPPSPFGGGMTQPIGRTPTEN